MASAVCLLYEHTCIYVDCTAVWYEGGLTASVCAMLCYNYVHNTRSISFIDWPFGRHNTSLVAGCPLACLPAWPWPGLLTVHHGQPACLAWLALAAKRIKCMLSSTLLVKLTAKQPSCITTNNSLAHETIRMEGWVPVLYRLLSPRLASPPRPWLALRPAE